MNDSFDIFLSLAMVNVAVIFVTLMRYNARNGDPRVLLRLLPALYSPPVLWLICMVWALGAIPGVLLAVTAVLLTVVALVSFVSAWREKAAARARVAQVEAQAVAD